MFLSDKSLQLLPPLSNQPRISAVTFHIIIVTGFLPESWFLFFWVSKYPEKRDFFSPAMKFGKFKWVNQPDAAINYTFIFCRLNTAQYADGHKDARNMLSGI